MSENLPVRTADELAMQKFESLALSVPENERSSVIAEALLVAYVKRTRDRGATVDRTLNPSEAFAYTLACRRLELQSTLSHIIPLEGQLYITLDGYLYIAARSNRLVSIKKTFNKIGEKHWECKAIVTRMSNDGRITQEFEGEGVANMANWKAGQYKDDKGFKDMAEARAKRRALKEAFPAGLPSYEDKIEYDVESTASFVTDIPEDKMNEYTISINSATTLEEYKKVMESINSQLDSISSEDQETIMELAISKKEELEKDNIVIEDFDDIKAKAEVEKKKKSITPKKKEEMKVVSQVIDEEKTAQETSFI